MIEARIQSAPSRYATPEGRVLLGRYFLARGADAKKVLDQCYDVAVKQRPDLVEANLAIAELALDKQDGALAATTLAKAPSRPSKTRIIITSWPGPSTTTTGPAPRRSSMRP